MKLVYYPMFFIFLSFGLASPLKEENLEDYELEFDLDEYFEEMTVDNIQPKSALNDDLVGESAFHSSSGTEIINEDAIDEEVRRGDERSNYASWKVILMVGGAAVGLVARALVGAIIISAVSRKRAATNKTEASILKETQISALSPVPEAGVSHNSSRDISNVGVTPVQKKKRKLYKQTPQLSEVSAVFNIIVFIYSYQ